MEDVPWGHIVNIPWGHIEDVPWGHIKDVPWGHMEDVPWGHIEEFPCGHIEKKIYSPWYPKVFLAKCKKNMNCTIKRTTTISAKLKKLRSHVS